jgi:hypothetical protein
MSKLQWQTGGLPHHWLQGEASPCGFMDDENSQNFDFVPKTLNRFMVAAGIEIKGSRSISARTFLFLFKPSKPLEPGLPQSLQLRRDQFSESFACQGQS